KHARNALAHLTEIAEIGEHPHNERVARKMDALLLSKLFEGHRRGRQPGAAHGDVVVEHPNFDGRAGESVVAMGDGIDQGFLPSEGRILKTLAEKEIV